MIDPSCKTCPFFRDGDCHHANRHDHLSVGSEWWCSNHPLAPGQRDRIALEILKALIAHHGLIPDRLQYSPYEDIQTVSLIHLARSLAHDFLYETEKGKT